MRMKRLKFSIATLLGVTALVALVIGVVTYASRQRQRTIAIYDAQKRVVDETIDKFKQVLSREGFHVTDDSRGYSGSGEWRQIVAIVASRENESQSTCYVEVMGFVTHNKSNEPTWMGILPMRISHRDRKLNARFIQILVNQLEGNRWKYSIDSNCKGSHMYSDEQVRLYLGKD